MEVIFVLFGILVALPFAILAAHGRERTVYHIHTIRHEYTQVEQLTVVERKLLKG